MQWHPKLHSAVPLIMMGLLLLFVTHPIFAMGDIDGSKKSYSLHHDNNQPVLDGVLDEVVWQQATVIELKYENDPRQGVLTPIKTLAYLYEDGASLHVAIKAFDQNPSAIRANLRERDNIDQDDNVGIIIDTFNDQRSGFGFFANALGAQADFSKQDFGDDGSTEDDAWDAIWESAGKVANDGYVVEMSIPFRALRFPTGGGELTWNIAVQRKYPRERLIKLANYRKNIHRKCTLCQYDALVGFKGIEAGNNIQLTPTLTLGRTDMNDVVGESGWQQGDIKKEVGVDLRWGISENVVLNATLNPDFSQVEADSAQLNVNNTYALFFDEKRPFFLDGADYLTTPLFNFVHSRNIANPDYGAKLTGKTDVHRYGLMVANDNRTDFLIPGNQGSSLATTDIESTAVVGRYRMDVGEQSSVGALLTSRHGDDYKNQLLAVDGEVWFSPTNSLSYQLAHSATRNPLQVQQDFGLDKQQQGQAYLLGVNHKTNTLYLAARLERVDADFRSDLGFQERANYQELSLSGRRTWFPEGDGWLSEYSVYTDLDKSWDIEGVLLEDELEISGTIKGAMQSTIEIGTIFRHSLFADKYYQEQQVTFWGEVTPISGLAFSAFIRAGDRIDFDNARLGKELRIYPYVNWQVNQHLQLEVEYEYTHLKVSGGELYNTGLTNTKFIWQFDSRSQVRFILQHTDIERDLSLYRSPVSYDAEEQYFTSQLLYSYKINPQTLFFLGYSDSGYADDDQESLTRTERTLFAKFSYAWQH